MSEKRILEELAEFAVELRFEGLSDALKKQANRCVLDLMGCYFAAFAIKGNRRLLESAPDLNPKPEATIWGMGFKSGMAEAALVHGCLGYHLEYDDGISLGAHWGSEAIPAVLAAAEATGCGGKEFLSALIVAYEVGNRISRAFSGDMLARGVHFPCAMGAFGAAAGVSKIMGLSVAETTSALGNGCLSPVAPYGPAFSGAPIKDAYSGWPNALGIHMVQLARAGWGGAKDLLEGPEGLGHALGWKAPAHELRKKILEGIGEEFEIMRTYFKPYPCCRWLHAPAVAVIDLKRSYGWDAADVASIRVEGPRFLEMYDKKQEFEHVVKARYSLPYVMAAVSLYGRLGVEEFEQSRRTDAMLVDLADRIEVETAPDLDTDFPPNYATRVTVILRDGKRLKRKSVLPWGPENPPSDRELSEKFTTLAGSVLDHKMIQAWLNLFERGIENDERLEETLGLLSRPLAREGQH